MQGTANDNLHEIKALISLIDEPDHRIYEQISDTIVGMGSGIIPVLQAELDNAFDELMRQRLADLIRTIHFHGSIHELQRWKLSDNKDLVRFLMIIDHFHDFSVDLSAVETMLADIQKDIWIELSQNITSLESIHLVNHVLFKVRALKPFAGETITAEHFLLHSLLHSRVSHPWVLGAFYVGICQRLTLPVYFVDLPDNFLAAYVSDLPEGEKLSEPLFYINPLLDGVAFDHGQIVRYLNEYHIPVQEIYFRPLPNEKAAIRILDEMVLFYNSARQPDRARQAGEMIQIIKG